MNNFLITSKRILVEDNEINVDFILENDMILCGTCMYYSKELDCIMGLSAANVTIYQGGIRIASTVTSRCGSYYLIVPKACVYRIGVEKNQKRKVQDVFCNYSEFCLKNIVFS